MRQRPVRALYPDEHAAIAADEAQATLRAAEAEKKANQESAANTVKAVPDEKTMSHGVGKGKAEPADGGGSSSSGGTGGKRDKAADEEKASRTVKERNAKKVLEKSAAAAASKQ